MTIQQLLAIALLIGVSTVNAQDEASDEKGSMKAEHEFHRGEMMAKMKMRHKQKAKEHYKSLDTNNDGKVDLEEYLRSSKERFSMMDINEDGFVTSEEAREARKNMHEKQNAERHKGRFERNKEESTNDSE